MYQSLLTKHAYATSAVVPCIVHESQEHGDRYLFQKNTGTVPVSRENNGSAVWQAHLFYVPLQTK